MAYADKEREKEVKRKWYQENQDRVKASRERYNEKRRQERLDPEVLAVEARRKRMKRLKMNEEEYAVYEQQQIEHRRKYHREWNRKHYNIGRYAKIKARMETDPEFAARIREQQARANAKRRGTANETPEQRERRLQRDREYRARIAREKKLMEQLVPAKPKEVKPKAPPPALKQPTYHKPRMGRYAALSKWYGY